MTCLADQPVPAGVQRIGAMRLGNGQYRDVSLPQPASQHELLALLSNIVRRSLPRGCSEQYISSAGNFYRYAMSQDLFPIGTAAASAVVVSLEPDI